MSPVFRHILLFQAVLTLLASNCFALDAETVPFSHLWGGFATSLSVRSPQQRNNTAIAANELNGLVIPPGGIFSFNERVGARERNKGYTEAPFIDAQGQLQDTPGGGICQLASTIYNAGLQAGMTVVERHPHSRVVGHVPPGRDATIASWRKDLKLGNPFPYPLQLQIHIDRNRLTSSFRSTVAQPFKTEIVSTRHLLFPETVVRQGQTGNNQNGSPGYRVTTRRIISSTSGIQEETISDDSYPAPSRIIGGQWIKP